MEGPMEGPKQRKNWTNEMTKVLLETCIEEMQTTGRNGTSLYRLSWVRLEGSGASASGASASRPSASGASASQASASRASVSGASAIRERVGALTIDEDPLVDVDIDDEDYGNSRTQRLHGEVRPKKKAKTSCVTFDDLAVDMQVALRHMVKTKDEPTSAECYEKLKLVGLQSMDPLFLAAFNIFDQSRDMREAWMALPSDPDVLKGWIQMTGRTFGIFK
ncbi:hypothetical protein CTI12_AA505140 [Artemisia annua]|uniref:Myb/SANT-like domain-containing protein n=1 Tax=Artemisia annua TaxID=35608 RepID=A0A2U1LC84_ARTAN|nr:hypothetical protein CTI12_AA505140 [Artemisia annua]